MQQNSKSVNFYGVNAEAPTKSLAEGFGVSEDTNHLKGGQNTNYRAGDVVLKRTDNISFANWIAGFFESLPGSSLVRFSKPVRSRGGACGHEGYVAWTFLKGTYVKVLCIGLVAYFLLSVFHFTSTFYTNSFLSDYESVIRRLELLFQGELSLWKFLSTKQINHNHFFVFLLAYLDYFWFASSQKLLVVATFLSNIALLAVVVTVFWQSKVRTSLLISLFTLYAASHIFSYLGAETFIFPFQAVLSTYRLFLILTIFLFCLPSAGKRVSLPLLAYVLLLFLTSISHGSGIITAPSLLVASLILRKWPHAIATALTLTLFSLYQAASPSQSEMGLSSVVFSAVPHLGLVASRSLYVLGYYSGAGLFTRDPMPSLVVGLVGFLLFVGFALRFLLLSIRNHQHQRAELFFVIWGAFGLVGSLMSVVMNIAYAPSRGIEMDYAYFLASRYQITTAGFWVSLGGLLALWCYESRRRAVRIFAASVLAVGAITSWCGGILSLPLWSGSQTQFLYGEVALRTGVLFHLPPLVATQLMALPPGFEKAIPSLASILRSRGLGPFSKAVENETKEQVYSPKGVSVPIASYEYLENGFTLVRGTLPMSWTEALRFSARPAPLVNERREIVGLVVFNEAPYLTHQSMEAPHFFGYAIGDQRKELYAMFTQESSIALKKLSFEGDAISLSIGYALREIFTDVGCFFDLGWEKTFVSENFTDVNWTKGISRGYYGLFTNNFCVIRSIKVGDTLIFKNSGSRTVTSLNKGQISLDKPITKSDGYPAEIRLVQR
jgi:hypothetical protein